MNDPRADEPHSAGSIYKTRFDAELLAIAGGSLFVGAAVGLVSASFRLLLIRADRFRDTFFLWAHDHAIGGFFLAVLVCAAAAGAAAWLVRRFSPYASGSGIPHVENVLHGNAPPSPPGLILVKFFGGVLAIGSGLALGREGPSVQMGASIANISGEYFRFRWKLRRVLIASGAGAGLAAAFNAPVAGAIFVLEELVREFELHIAIAALGASATAIWVSQAILGPAPEFHVEELAFADPLTSPLYFLFGAFAGAAAVLYCRAILRALSFAQQINRAVPGLTAMLIGAVVGGVGWFSPQLVGGGDPITQKLLVGTQFLPTLVLVFCLRFALGPASYATATPGGIFAPMMVLGAQLGMIFGEIGKFALPSLFIQPVAFAVVGMAAFFTAVVRAPLTGIALVTEMTSDATLLLPMLASCFCAMIAPTLAGEAPIYDSLRSLAASGRQSAGAPAPQSRDAEPAAADLWDA
jgi:chloride channel protein, CIC family